MLHWRNPLSSAYSDAFNAVKGTIERQQASDRARAELFASLISIAVTIPVGGWMTARMGHATLSRAVGDASLRLVLRGNQRLLYRAADHVLDSEASRYMLGEAFDFVTGKISKSLTNAAASGLTSNPFQAAMTEMKSEMKFFLELDTWVRAHSSFLLTMARNLRSSSLSQADRNAVAAALGRSRFIQDAPMSSRVPSHVRAAESLELSLWMGILLSMDYKMTSYEDWGGNSSRTGWRNAGSISQMPSDPNYPRERRAGSNGTRHGGGVKIGYRAPGSHVLNRVEELYGKYVPGQGAFLRGKSALGVSWMEHSDGFDAGELGRAERALPIIARQFR
ncbi:hypothetical protein SAMN04488095_0787 [Jannaschia pohangensis]|uniref:Uncharacterized protein n=2 Tax=Jannaschia pohangensis TaxID=390807 RepID=A0A1I3I279_9RHOB|nr:hypothetical protein SAMN04488095_0787 [Jannaschia pohangensis]